MQKEPEEVFGGLGSESLPLSDLCFSRQGVAVSQWARPALEDRGLASEDQLPPGEV